MELASNSGDISVMVRSDLAIDPNDTHSHAKASVLAKKLLFQATAGSGGLTWRWRRPLAQAHLAGVPAEVMVTAPKDRETPDAFSARVDRLSRKFSGLVLAYSQSMINNPKYRTPALAGANRTFVVRQKGGPIRAREISALLRTVVGVPEFSADAAVAAANEDLGESVLLRDPQSGRLDARRVASLYGLPVAELAKLAGRTRQAVNQNPSSIQLQEFLQDFEEAATYLRRCDKDPAKFRMWLNKPNREFPKLGSRNASPMDFIKRGHISVVATLVRNLNTGHPS